MIRQRSIATPEPDDEDRSMRVVEYTLAFVAAAIAGILAFLR
jgi:hypothetical protein